MAFKIGMDSPSPFPFPKQREAKKLKHQRFNKIFNYVFPFFIGFVGLGTAISFSRKEIRLGLWQFMTCVWMLMVYIYQKENNMLLGALESLTDIFIKTLMEFKEIFKIMARKGLIEFTENGFPWHFPLEERKDKENELSKKLPN